jgi:hypothetical protein
MFSVIRGPIRRNKDDLFLETHLYIGEMSRKEFCHSESANAVSSENLKEKTIVENLRSLLTSSHPICIEKEICNLNAF